MAKSPVSSGGGQRGAHEDRAAATPDGDLRQADGAHAQQLAGQQIAGLGHGQHHLEDARGLLLDDGAGHIQTVEHDGHGEQNRPSDSPLRTMALPLLLPILPSLSICKVSMETCFSSASASAWLMPLAVMRSFDHAAVQGVLQSRRWMTVAGGERGVGGRDLFRLEESMAQHSVDGLGAEPVSAVRRARSR